MNRPWQLCHSEIRIFFVCVLAALKGDCSEGVVLQRKEALADEFKAFTDLHILCGDKQRDMNCG